jgi:hypothetical protein
MPSSPSFFLGKVFDLDQNDMTGAPVIYDPGDLTTHAVVTGMTGSGKTGFCVCLLEEAALQGLPALVVDPKGDLTNLILHFPDLAPADFEPWVDPEAARRKGISPAEMAESTAALWKKGLGDWGFGYDQLQALKESVDFTIYTPGSTAGTPVNILSSFEVPAGLTWDTGSELMREKISTTITALLGLVGMTDIDPLRSREHILLSNILENAWREGHSLDLTDLIMQTQEPSFDRLGAFPLDRFFPEKDRFDLAMLLNNILASPTFETWREGEPLDIQAMLFTQEGRPRHSIFYIAHLNETERMFFVTLLFASVEAWMRTQRGTSGLRALLYFDEVLGYLPPVKNPPSRPIMLRMLKQARAFGVGLVLATQNPVDLDYKALSNAGTWVIGRLQTDQDKERLLDGLESAAGGLPRKQYDKLISGLKKRVFLLHNVHEKEPVIFHTRWAMNYLAGPMTRAQIPQLMALVGDGEPQSTAAPAAATAAVRATPSAATGSMSKTVESPLTADYLVTREAVANGIEEIFVPVSLDPAQAIEKFSGRVTEMGEPQGLAYRPSFLVQSEVRFTSKKYVLTHIEAFSALIEEEPRGLIRWEDVEASQFQVDRLHREPQPGTCFVPIPGWLSQVGPLKSLKDEFVDWIYRTKTVNVRANEKLQVHVGPDATNGEFRELCSKSARQEMDKAVEALKLKYEKKLDALEARRDRQELEVDEAEDEVNQRRLEELGTHGELLVSMFSKRRRSVSKSLTKRRMTSQAKSDLEQEIQELEALEKQIAGLEAEMNQSLQAVKAEWANAVDDVTEVPISPYKKDIFVQMFGIVWMPYYLFKEGQQIREIPAY